MFLTVTVNPSVDKRYMVKGFEKGQVFRADKVQYTAGGKGLNVSKVLRDLGKDVVATGLLGGNNGKFITDQLIDFSINNQFTEISNETRSCLAILANDYSQTEVLEPGPNISEKEVEVFGENYEILLEDCNIVCASGSLPRRVNPGLYGELIRISNKKDKKFILDTSGKALKEGIKASPFMIKPNKEELEALFNTSINNEEELIRGLKDLEKYNINIIVVSLGSEGAMVCHDGQIYKIRIPDVKAINPVGSGDAMIAGFATGIVDGYSVDRMLKFASACGTANALEEETGRVDRNNINKLMDDIMVMVQD